MALERDDFPEEITLFHILPRVPARSLLRFMCVSKQWHAFLRTPMFKKLHLQHINHQKLLLLSTAGSTVACKFYTIDCESPNNGLSACRASPFETYPGMIHVLTSFHGLVCVGIKNWPFGPEYSDLVLWNPLTQEHITLSKGSFHHECYKISGGAFSLYHTSSDDDYKLLRVTHGCSDIYIYSLKSDSWRILVGSLGRYIRTNFVSAEDHWWPSIWLNENLYFFRVLLIKPGLEPSYLISKFDTKTEKFTEILTPSFKINTQGHPVGLWRLLVLKGCIHLCMGYYDHKVNSMSEIQMWRMDGDEDEDGGWTKVLTYNNIPLLPLLVAPLHIMRTGHWIVYSIKGYFFQVDLEKNIKDVILCPHGIDRYGPKGKYVETLVSPNQYMN